MRSLPFLMLLLLVFTPGCRADKEESCTASFTLSMPDGTSTTLDYCAGWYSMDAAFEFDPHVLG